MTALARLASPLCLSLLVLTHAAHADTYTAVEVLDTQGTFNVLLPATPTDSYAYENSFDYLGSKPTGAQFYFSAPNGQTAGLTGGVVTFGTNALTVHLEPAAASLTVPTLFTGSTASPVFHAGDFTATNGDQIYVRNNVSNTPTAVTLTLTSGGHTYIADLTSGTLPTESEDNRAEYDNSPIYVDGVLTFGDVSLTANSIVFHTVAGAAIETTLEPLFIGTASDTILLPGTETLADGSSLSLADGTFTPPGAPAPPAAIMPEPATLTLLTTGLLGLTAVLKRRLS